MTDDERAAIERAVQRCCKACEDWRGDSHPPDEDVLADIIAAELSPLLAAKDERIAELEGMLHEAEVKLRENCLGRHLRKRITAALSPAAEQKETGA